MEKPDSSWWQDFRFAVRMAWLGIIAIVCFVGSMVYFATYHPLIGFVWLVFLITIAIGVGFANSERNRRKNNKW